MASQESGDPRIDHFHTHLDRMREVGIDFPATGMMRVGKGMYPVSDVTHDVVTPGTGGTIPDSKGGTGTFVQMPDERTDRGHSLTIMTKGVGADAQIEDVTFWAGTDAGDYSQDATWRSDGRDTDRFGEVSSGEQMAAEDFVNTIPSRLAAFQGGTQGSRQGTPGKPKPHKVDGFESVQTTPSAGGRDWWGLDHVSSYEYTPETGELQRRIAK